jgi:hypothetical protein
MLLPSSVSRKVGSPAAYKPPGYQLAQCGPEPTDQSRHLHFRLAVIHAVMRLGRETPVLKGRPPNS